MTFCAICASTRPPFVRLPLGKDDALVSVCHACDDEPARYKTGPELAYEAPEITTPFRAAVDAAHERIVQGRDRLDPRGIVAASMLVDGQHTPNMLLVRVPIRDSMGKPRDVNEARASFAHQPWSQEARYMGATRSHLIFERPDPNFARESRLGKPADPLASIRRYGGSR